MAKWNLIYLVGRVGRTGRAGKEGTAITLLEPSQVNKGLVLGITIYIW